MTLGLRRLFAFGVVFIFFAKVAGATAPTNLVWFSPENPYLAQELGGTGYDIDFFSLFAAGAPWPNAQAKVQVFKVSTNFLQVADPAKLQTYRR